MNADEFEKPQFEQAAHARALFDASVAHIDADTRHRLRDARGHALQPQSAAWLRRAWALPVGAALATVLALVVFWPHASAPGPAQVSGATDGAAIVAVAPQTHANDGSVEDTSVDNAIADSLIGNGTDGADPELLGNLDFYGWLAKQPALARNGG